MIQLDLIPATEHPSLTAPLPKGWQRHTFDCITGQTMAKSADQDGCVWYYESGWKLNVPYFRNTNGTHKSDNIAVLEHITDRHLEAPITEKGTITINGRRIKRHQWNH